MTFGEKVRATRIERGFSQEELGKLCNLSGATISLYESNSRTPHYNSVLMLSKALHVSLSYLVKEDDDDECTAEQARP